MKEENIADLGTDGDLAKGEKVVDKKPKQQEDYRGKAKISREQKAARIEIEGEERQKLEAEKQEKIRERAEKIKKERAEASEKIQIEEKEIAKIKEGRMHELGKTDFLKPYKCPQCGAECEIFTSQKPDRLIIWSACEKCTIKETKLEEAQKINFPIYWLELPIKNFFKLQAMGMPNGITKKDLEIHRIKNKRIEEAE